MNKIGSFANFARNLFQKSTIKNYKYAKHIILGGGVSSIGVYCYYNGIINSKPYYLVSQAKSDDNVVLEPKSEESDIISEQEDVNEIDIFGKIILQDDNVEKSLPTEVPYLIIGGGIAGLSAARSIRASDPLSKILIINDEIPDDKTNTDESNVTYLPYRRYMLSKRLWSISEEKLKEMFDSSGDAKTASYFYLNPESFYVKPEELNRTKYGGISILNGHKVTKLDPEERTIKLNNIEQPIKYKSCLLATGCRPRRLKNLEVTRNTQENLYDSGEISYYRNIHDFKKLRSKLKEWKDSNQFKRIVIIGGGLLGTELAWSLSNFVNNSIKSSNNATDKPKTNSVSHIEIIQVFRETTHLNRILPFSLGKYVSDLIDKVAGVRILNNSEAICTYRLKSSSSKKADQSTKKLRIDLGKSKKPADYDEEDETELKSPYKTQIKTCIYDVDHVIIAAGVQPNTQLADTSNLELAPSRHNSGGGFLSTPELQIRPGLYVAGDAASFYDPFINKRRIIEHWGHAEETGNIAGHNMAAFVMSEAIRDGCYGDDVMPSDNAQTASEKWKEIVQPEQLADDLLKQKTFSYNSEFFFNVGDRRIIGIGEIDTSLHTRTVMALDQYRQDFMNDSTYELELKKIQAKSKLEPLSMPGVVLYLQSQILANQTKPSYKIVGALLWNCDDEIIQDDDGNFPSPLRINIARMLIKEQTYFHEDREMIKTVAPMFDLSNYTNSQFQLMLHTGFESELEEEKQSKNSEESNPSLKDELS